MDILQRYVAWCQRKQGINEFGFILDDVALAENAARNIPDAYSDRFRRRRRDDAPTLHVPIAHIDELPDEVWQSWERAIQKEVQRGGRSGYLQHKRPFLFHAIRDETLRESILAEIRVSRGQPSGPSA